MDYLKELFEHRELLYFLVWRDVKVRYKQTVLGASWAVLQPFVTMLVFSLFFGMLAGMPSDGAPYPVFSFCALVPWTLFSQGMLQSSYSLVASQDLITKVYFPRIAIPLAAVLGCVLDFMIAFVVLVLMIVYYGIVPTPAVIYLPALVVLTVMTSFGVGLWFAALNVQYRDVSYVVPFVVQFWLFATPIAYPSSLLPHPWIVFYGINPMAGVVEGFRWALLGTGAAPGPMLLVSAAASAMILLGAVLYFRRTERFFADVV